MGLYTDHEIFNHIKQLGLTPDEYIIIDDLTKVNEQNLDFTKKIYARNINFEKHASNTNTRLLLDYLRLQGHDLELFFDTFPHYSPADLDNYYEWRPLSYHIQFLDDIQTFLGFKNPRDFLNIAKIASENDQTMTNLMNFATRLTPLRTIYETIPIFNRSYDNDLTFQYINSKRSRHTLKVVLLFRPFDNFKHEILFRIHFWSLGLLAGIPIKKGYSNVKMNIPYFGYNIMKLLNEDYGYLGLQVKENQDALEINGLEYAKKVYFKEKTVDQSASFVRNFFNFIKKNPGNSSRTKMLFLHDSSNINNEQMTLIEGYQISRDLISPDGQIVLKEGEVFNMPYSCFEIEIDLVSRKHNKKEIHNFSTLKTHLTKMRQQIVELEETRSMLIKKANEAENAKNELEELNRNLENKVIERTRQLEELNEKQSTFFVNLAHETKTPLTIIINIFDTYIKRVGTSEELEIIQANLDLLKRNMINFLDHEKLSKGQIFYNHEHYFSLTKFLNHKLIMFDDIARNKQIKLTSNIQDNVIIRIDPAAMDRVINNLLDNAVKFSNFGGNIGVELKTDNNFITLIVSDNGIGIEKNKLNDIFTPYHQISHNKRNIQGIGMGLAIVKGIMDDIKGTIKVKSEVDIHTTFTVTFPAVSFDNNNAKELLELPKPSHPYKKTITPELDKFPKYDNKKPVILVVEDNKDMLRYLQTELSDEYNFYYADDGEKGLKVLEEIPKPDLIISDIMMDKMNGLQFKEALKSNKKFDSIPLIYLTAKTGDEHKLTGLEQGAVLYMAKPFNIAELKHNVTSLISLDKTQYIYTKMEIRQKDRAKFKAFYKIHDLNERQIQVMECYFEGMSQPDIAEAIGLKSRSSINNIFTKIYDKTNTKSKPQLVRKILDFIFEE